MIARALLEKETLNSKEIKALVEGRELPEPEEEADQEPGDKVPETEKTAAAGSNFEISGEAETVDEAKGLEAGGGETKKDTARNKQEDRQASFRQHAEQGEKPTEDH